MDNDNPWIKKTNYIWMKKENVCNSDKVIIMQFRREFLLEELPDNMIVEVSADTRYSLMVNGEEVCFGPRKGDTHVWYYDSIDLKEHLIIGKNVIAAKVLRYPTESSLGNLSMIRTEIPFFYLKETDNKYGISTDEQWKVKQCYGIQVLPESDMSRYLWNKEIVDGCLLDHGWETREYDDSQWTSASVYKSGEVQRGSSPRNLKQRPIPFLYKKERNFHLKCIRQSQIGEQEWKEWLNGNTELKLEAGSCHIAELDAQELTTGFPVLSFMGGKHTEFKFLVAESYWVQKEDGSFVKRDREDEKSGRLIGYEDCYIAAGTGCEALIERYSPFLFKTFRFLKLTILVGDEPLQLKSFVYQETGYPLQVKTHVETSDAQLNKIWDISLRTLKRCMHETYEDCPYYEQLQYAMDTRIQILFTYYVSGDDRLARACLDDFYRSLRPDGLTNCCYPSSGTNLIPGFSLYYIFMLYDHMMYYGDKNFLIHYFLGAEKILEFFEEKREDNGLIGKIGGYNGEHEYWSFIDWTQKWKWGVPNAIIEGSLTMENLLYVLALQKMSHIADYLGKTESGNYFRETADDLKKIILENCWDEEAGLFEDGPGYKKDYSQHTQVFAVLTGIAKGEYAKELMEKTLENQDLAKCSVAMSWYLFRAIEMSGLYDEGTKSLWEPWRKMLSEHMTTCVESPGEGRSDCHAWGATALYEIPAVILGIRPTKPGFTEASIHPLPGYLNWAKGTVATPRGEIYVEWRKESEKVKITYENLTFNGKIEIM